MAPSVARAQPGPAAGDIVFLFGLTADQVLARRPTYQPWNELADSELARVIREYARTIWNVVPVTSRAAR